MQVDCESQDEVDRYWATLSEGGEEGPCGWLKDRFGLSWQIIPTALTELLADPDQDKSQRVMKAMLTMKDRHRRPAESRRASVAPHRRG